MSWKIIEVKLTIRCNFENLNDEEIAESIADSAMDGFGYPLGVTIKGEILSKRDIEPPPKEEMV